jgi:D-glycero-D-manno-heptose 1,7-bisphosphate phosphatase
VGIGALRAVFLDRDGVLNGTRVEDGVPRPPRRVAELEILPRVPEAIAMLATGGLRLIVVTNQPDVARGTQTRERVEEINAALRQRLPLDAVMTCYHDDADNCACRKPRPGLILEAAREHGIDVSRSFLVGDRWVDIGAGRAAGCLTLLVDAPYNRGRTGEPHYVVADLLEAARVITRLLEPKSRGTIE